MTATERLRQLLDERDEYYKVSGNKTWWGRPIDARTGEPINVFHNQAQPMGDDRLFVELQLATPERAIEATLGRGTCRLESMHGYTDPYVATRYVVELNCHTLDDWPESEPPAYCPWCGAKVVDA